MSASLLDNRIVLSDEELASAFQLLDVDQDGLLARAEMSVLLRTINVEPTKKELDFIFEEIDVEGQGKINLAAFVNYMRNPFRGLFTKEQVEDIYHEVAEDDGGIRLDDIKQILKEMINEETEDLLEKLFIKADIHDDGLLSISEFVKLMKKMKICY
uniref:Calmodulin n=1 Tax=Rhabditophanes sp. KR3021 TaxID=114890 RepID=A0AC35TUC0_9BILA